jgi:hypothetical protein
MAKAFSDVFHDDYIAGIWRNDIWNGLSWQNSSLKFEPTTKQEAIYICSADGAFVENYMP